MIRSEIRKDELDIYFSVLNTCLYLDSGLYFSQLVKSCHHNVFSFYFLFLSLYFFVLQMQGILY